MMPIYNSIDFRPSAPFALVEIKNQATGAFEPNVPMLIDTGADITIVPLWVIDNLNLGIEQDRSYEVAGFGSAINLPRAVQLEMIFCHKTFRGRFLTLDQKQQWGILGRNVLNLVSIFLDGPNLAWREQK